MARGFRLTSPDKIKLTENDVEKACVDLLRWKHYPQRLPAGRYLMPDRAVIELCRQHNVPLRWITIGEPGIPDYVIPAWFMEVKRPGGILSDVQQLKIMELERTWSLPVAVVESLDELIEWLALHPELARVA
jgi:hypothetical protein